jgi:predicted exporter
VRIAEALTPAQAPKIEDGVWVSRNAPRAVLVLTTKADGADLDGQEAALNAVRRAFVEEAQRPGADVAPGAALRLELSGAGSFGVASRERIKSEVERLAVWGGAIMVVLLWLAFGSPRALVVARAAGRDRRARGHRRGRARLRPGATA